MLSSVYRKAYRKLYHSLRRTVYSSVFLLKLNRFCCPLRSLFYFILLFFCPPFSISLSVSPFSPSLSHLQSSSRVVRLTLKIYGHQFGRLSRELTALHSLPLALPLPLPLALPLHLSSISLSPTAAAVASRLYISAF